MRQGAPLNLVSFNGSRIGANNSLLWMILFKFVQTTSQYRQRRTICMQGKKTPQQEHGMGNTDAIYKAWIGIYVHELVYGYKR
jgi:hypothetical protein